jgi:hypothetical protein
MTRRIVKTPADRVLRDEFGLEGWVAKPADRRSAYFGWCEQCEARIATLCGEDGPDDDAVVKAIAACLDVDDTFQAHVEGRREDAEMLIDDEQWDRIIQVGARQIYREYLVAKEKEEWP